LFEATDIYACGNISADLITMHTVDLRELETLFLALGDKTRLRLLGMMADGPVAVGLLAEKLGESQPKVSRHLAYLRNAGVVSTERDGKYVYYGIQAPADERVNNVLDAVIGALTDAVPAPRTRRTRAAVLPAQRFDDPSEDHVEEVVVETEPFDNEEYTQPEPPEREELDIFLL
jgi:ArsR family transcriptional regulator, arsenate/arsenite/antimonite-responsive transcriptional repressor